jgi:hypothetical protein
MTNFQYNQMMQDITFGREIMEEGYNGSTIRYSLVACLCHYGGKTLQSGHYIGKKSFRNYSV